MRLTTVILIAAIMQVSASGFAQKISMNKSNATLKIILKELRIQSGYNFVYTDNLLKKSSLVNINVKDMLLKDVLEQIFHDQPLTYSVDSKTVIIEPKETSFVEQLIKRFKAIDVHGKVVDQNGDPIPGATVKVKGTSQGAVTRTNGEFNLTNVEESALLQISYLGFTPLEVPVKAEMGAIKLTAANAKLDEVVVVGYGVQKKANLTGAVDQVNGDVLRDRPITRVSQGLQGLVANLNILSSSGGGMPNATQSINIRGYTGLGTSGSPLIVIDGIPGGDINSINPSDIENISVLKDQASAAIYGVDGAFGVILINTKQGKKNSPARVTYDNNFGAAQLLHMPKETNSLEYVTMFNEAAVNGGSAAIFQEEQIQRIKDYLAGTLKTETMANALGTEWVTGQLGNANNKWFDVLFKDWSMSQQHNIGLSGGGENTSYFVGLGYNNKKGFYNYGNDDFKRYNFRTNLGVDVTPWLKLNFRSTFSRAISDNPFTFANRSGGGLGAYMHQAGRTAPYVANVNPDGGLSNFSDAAWLNSGSRTLDNEDQFLGTGEFIINPFKGFNITGNYTLTSLNFESSQQGKTFFVAKPTGALGAFGQVPNTFSRVFGKSNNQLINFFSSYENTIGDHSFKVLGGYIRRSFNRLYTTSANSNLYTDNLPSLSLTYNDKPSVSDEIAEYATEGFFSRINYAYKEKFLLEFNGRYDATSRFITNRWQFYPGVSGGYIVSKERFFEPLSKVVNFMKIRASYGKSGDQASLDSYYPFYPAMNTVLPASTNWFFQGGRQAYVSAPGVVNPDISWQKPVMLDIGADLSFLGNRLDVGFDWYKRTMKDLIVAGAPLPATFGTAAPRMNNGETETTGFELTIAWKDHIGSLNYGLRGVLSDYTGKVTKYTPNPTKLLSSTYYEGSTLGQIWGYVSPGLYTADQAKTALPASFWGGAWTAGDVQYLDLDNNQRIDIGKNTADDPGDRKVIGNNTPRYSYGLNIDLEYKGFDAGIFMQGVAKRDAWVGSNYFWGITGSQFQSSFFETQRDDRWTADNPGGYYPKYYMTSQMDKNTQVSTRYLQNAAYFRLKSVQIGYSLPKTLIDRIHLSKLRFYVTGENLATITKMVKTIDPELALIDASSGVGKVYPLQRTFSFGLNVGL